MEVASKREYENVQKEIEEIRQCITDYMKMFFTIGVGVVAVFAFVIEDKAISNIEIYPALVAYLPLVLCYITLTFASILFHKFNTHNRGCGYLRALELEVHVTDECSGTVAKWRGGEQIRLWQSVLAAPFQEEAGGEFAWGYIETDSQFEALSTKVKEADKLQHPFNVCNFPSTLCHCLRGLGMILQSTVFRARTRSWTFPFQIAFGPFSTSLFLVLAWFVIVIVGSPATEPPHRLTLRIFGHYVLLDRNNLRLQVFFAFWLCCCWLGLCYRLFRLCADQGDRTIEAWCWRAMVARRRALADRGLKIRYIGLLPKGSGPSPVAGPAG